MRHRHVDRHRPGGQGQPRGGHQRATGAGHVVDQHDRPATTVDPGRQRDFDVAIAAALLDAPAVIGRRRARPRGFADPLCGLFIRPEQQRLAHVSSHPRADQRRGRQRDGFASGHHLVQRGDAVQVRIDRHHGIKAARQQAADVALADRLAGRERDVLPHVGEIRARQQQALRTQLAGGRRGDQQLDQLLVGLMQAAQQHHARGQRGGQAQLQFAVGEAVSLDQRQRHVQRTRQRCGHLALVVEGQHAAGGSSEAHQELPFGGLRS